MKKWKDRRRELRTSLEPPDVGLLIYAPDGASEGPFDAYYVDLINRSLACTLVRTPKEMDPDARFFLHIYDARARAWVAEPAARLIEEFGTRAREAGITLKATPSHD